LRRPRRVPHEGPARGRAVPRGRPPQPPRRSEGPGHRGEGEAGMNGRTEASRGTVVIPLDERPGAGASRARRRVVATAAALALALTGAGGGASAGGGSADRDLVAAAGEAASHVALAGTPEARHRAARTPVRAVSAVARRG